MENNTTSAKKEQKNKVSHNQSYAAVRAAVQEELAAKINDLEITKKALGYGDVPWASLLQISIEDLDQAQASQVIGLQESYQAYQAQKQTIEDTVYLEPSKLPEAVDAAEQLLLKHGNDIYQRSGKLVRVSKILHAPLNKNAVVKRAVDSLIIKEIDQSFLTVFLTKIGSFVIFDGRSGTFKKIDCPERVSKYLIAKQEWILPVLTGTINAPTLRADGSILDTPGYDAKSGLLFSPGGYVYEKIPQQPSRDDAIQAMEVLLTILKDFPFVDEASRSVALAAILTALVRRSIATAPLIGFTAPKMASGKSLAADVVALISTGKVNSVIAQAENETEEKKRVLALLMEGDPIICYDNVEKPFKSAALCSILTQHEYKDRVLGSNETRTVLTNATFLVTGNNLVFMGDISTRSLLCKLDPKLERPEEKTFDVDLRTYIPQHRPQLVKAGLTILRAYFIAGKPVQNIKQFGRFEEWSNLIRSAIVWLGMADPCESRREIEESDPVRIQLSALFTAWYNIFGEQPIKVKTLVHEAVIRMTQEPDDTQESLYDVILDLVGDNKDVINKRSLAKKLFAYKNRIENGLRLEQGERNQGTTQWRIRKVAN
jgi:hypothetical protein